MSPSLTATHVGIGLEKTEYTTHDNDDYHVVCAVVQSGSIGGRDIMTRYIIEDAGKMCGPCVVRKYQEKMIIVNPPHK